MKPDWLTLLDLALKGTCVLLLGFAVAAILRRISAAHRSLSWLAVFLTMSMLPIGLLLEPPLKLPVVVVKQTTPAPVSELKPDPFARAAPGNARSSQKQRSSDAWSRSWSAGDLAIVFYLGGTLLVLAFRLAGTWHLRRVRSDGFAADARMQELVGQFAAGRGIRRCIETVISSRVAVPMTWGTLRPVLVLPACVKTWCDDELRAALQHEVAHIAHHDAARRWLGTLVCALWWPHPLVWLAAKAWRLEQERSCDDAVIRGGTDANRYATQLLNVAKAARLGRLQSAAALVMAMPSGLETRLRGVVNAAVSRAEARTSDRLTAAICTTLVVAACLSLGARAAEDHGGRPITVRAKFIEIADDSAALRDEVVRQWQSGRTMTLDASAMDALMRRLAQKKDVDMLSAPSVTTKPGQAASVQVVREFVYPAEFTKEPDAASKSPTPVLTPKTFEMMPLGVLLDVTADWSGKQMSLRPTARVNEFQGYSKAGPTNMQQDKHGVWRVIDPASLAITDSGASAERRALNAGAKDRYEAAMAGIERKPDEVLVPQFTTQKWEGKASLKPDEWIVAALKYTSGQKKPGHGQVWVLISAGEARADGPKVGAAPAAANPPDQTLLQRARRIVLPAVDFKDAKLTEAIEFLRTKSRDADPAKQGLNIILKNDPPSTASITLSLRDVPLNEALRYTSELAGMELVWESYAAIVRPIGEPEGMEMFTRVYQTTAKLMGGETDAKKWLAAQSVVFGEGATASFDEKTAKLTVKNVPKELRKVDAILQRHGIATEPPKPAIVQSAEKIVFPTVSFRDATLTEAVEFFRVKSKEVDPEKKGINIVLVGDAAKSPAKLTLDLKQVPLTEALKYVTALAGVQLVPREATFDITPLTTEAGN
ncbi:MAG: M56 family metallopeptidase [Verrucomicrobiaceae bacterium]|nr:M56 family metallopeptidase [Verrucomicrobiaceae bacterium]